MDNELFTEDYSVKNVQRNINEVTNMIRKIPCEVFKRVVGYYRPETSFNNGKKEELKNRVNFKL